MLLLLATLHFLKLLGNQAAPNSFSTDIAARSQSTLLTPSCTCSDPCSRRTLWNIIWSCIATIFACTWIAVHPNIPAFDDSPLKIVRRRAGIMCWSLIAPEIVLLWAIRQWYCARKIAQLHKDRGWTKTHGFYLQMGGFMLHAAEEALYPLDLQSLEELENKGEVAWPKISEQEIEDKSKGDFLSKGLVVVQTSWFVLQCFARAIQGLAVTELELVTLAYAVLNVGMYFFWWNKPLNVRCSTAVYMKSDPHTPNSEASVAWRNAFGNVTQTSHLQTPVPTIGIEVHSPSENEEIPESFDSPLTTRILQGVKSCCDEIPHILLEIALYLLVFPFLAPGFMLALKMQSLGTTVKVDKRNRKMPSCFADSLVGHDEEGQFAPAFLGSAFIALIFGAVHCIGWRFDFPSHVEQVLWRVSALIITCVPALVTMTVALDYHSGNMSAPSDRFPISNRIGLGRLAFSFSPLYIIARIILLIQSLIGLRYIPTTTLDIVKWTTFILHI